MTVTRNKGKGRYGSASQREGAQKLRGMGFKEIGFKSGSHLVMMHDELGRMEVPIHTPTKIVVESALRKQKLIHNKAERVINHIMTQFDIEQDDCQIIEGSLTQMVKTAKEEMGGDIAQTRADALFESIRRHPRVKILRSARGTNGVGQYEFKGLRYIDPNEIIKSPVAPSLPPAGVSVDGGKPVHALPAEELPVIETDGVPDIFPDELDRRDAEEARAVHEMTKTTSGIDALAEYLDMKNRCANAEAQLELVKTELANVVELVRLRNDWFEAAKGMDNDLSEQLKTLVDLL